MNLRLNNSKVIIYTSIIITLILTPWVNSDSLVIPKVIMLFLLALFIIPKIISSIKNLSSDKNYKVILVLSFLIITQMVLVILNSSAPLEQQIFGRTGRGLGFITYASLVIIMLGSLIFIKFEHIKLLVSGVVISSLITSIYSIAQYYGYDFFSWSTRTNGIIGTLGNPNFQSSLAAVSLIPSIVYFFGQNRKKTTFSFIVFFILLFTIYICQSYQGYIVAVLGALTFLLTFAWYKKRHIFVALFLVFLTMVTFTILGMANKGPLSNYLFKYSVESRFEFWRTAITTANDNWLFGIGLDSFGDYSTIYKSMADANGVNEYVDNAHNYFLEYAATGGYLLAFLHLLILLLTLLSFMLVQKRIKKFDKNVSALFSAWVCLQAQSLISPGTIPLLLWISVISGSVIGIGFVNFSNISLNREANKLRYINLSNLSSYLLLIIGLIVTYPMFNADRLYLKSLNSGDALLAVRAAKMYPESSLRYGRIGMELLDSNLPKQSLEVAKSAIDFNPNSITAWALVLGNDLSSPEEKKKAYAELVRLDPFSKVIRDLKF